MNNLKIIFFSITLTFLLACNTTPESNEIKGDELIMSKVDSLLKLMSLEEKVGQLSQRFSAGLDNKLSDDIKNGQVGSLLNGRKNFYTVKERNKIQKIAIEETRLGIPIIFGHDVIHGFRTIFPISLAQSCTWSPKLIERANSVAASEAAANGVDWAFAPMVDVSRDPRWGRIAESYGEDTYLNAVFSKAAVNGFQGTDVSSEGKVIACLKHFVGYGAATGGRDYQYTEISDRTMHEVYLPSFEAGVNAGALTVMSAFNDINGVPATANKKYIRETLKEKMNFNGFVVSDWDAVEELIKHGIASDKREAALLAINAGVDMEMKTLTYQELTEEVKANNLSENIIDEAVRRILFVKYKKGLFKNPYTSLTNIDKANPTLEKRKLARQIASESMVLLKNKENILPLKNKKINIAVVGLFANETNVMGWWQSLGKNEEVVTPYSGLKNNADSYITITKEVNSKTDVIIACVGESSTLFGENHSRTNIKLPNNQEAFLNKLKKKEKPIITVVFNGRPLDLTGVLESSEAVLIGWHPGIETGNALADLIYGKSNPSGKLTTSFPKSVGQIPVYYNQRNSGRPHQSNYRDETSKPLFPFGFGLSYSNFEYDNLIVSKEKLNRKDSLLISAKITNNSNVQGTEIVQLYVQDIVGSTTRPVKELKGFRKITLAPNESKVVNFTLKTNDLTVLNDDFNPIIEPGKFNIWISTNSDKGLKGTFEIE
ncbi:glycoside hydrolase family 3 C-terminal domain-containing protein [Polaribacter sp. Z014]|uniref:glycoside hydrolase family 3 N-terminal domain-containing protein n=1 Tax=Polaribacter sp. Z014 TaxID=2927126 RepID=UPI0020206AE4|nr:glycoside hydrolase family 3 N-terminal domain-containing protein [Polaribacter sp. Z014]MCL7762491.1 glycoside hydrolase family 3 C-terminal domain-containing protein [Polaribacter sp. Z014]